MTTLRVATAPAVVPFAGPWTLRPGWGIAVDLTPPQLLATRKARTVRKLVAAGLGLIVAALVAGYFVAARDRASAQDSLAGAQVRGAQLHANLDSFADITRIHGTVVSVRQQLSTVLAGNVAIDELLARIRAALPGDMTMQSASVTVSLTGAIAAGGGGAGLNDPEHPRIGNVALNGTSHDLGDLSEFVEHLQRQAGLVDVVPLTNTADKSGGAYSVALGFTDELQSAPLTDTPVGVK